ncbi:GNAT family N-acetyltransferase [Rhodothermus profundi]|uniref:Acetyltransferase (GNAT) domain-containing protein n=1 Tax=Rhodothermus profundi TaxID=633813 RepID=A0A1M6VQT4_9BACT|nr:GNAT family N-acetyltransferase [Rhodothermus profundi]SHK83829.1 Acetyltransferase (GNAT) domain-containing protein [Rhodothermus profundi]
MERYRAPVPSGAVLTIEEVGLEQLEVIRELNRAIFEEERIINTFDRDDLMILLARVDGVPVGFKIGYRENSRTFYSAKGGVLPAYRRQGIARQLLYVMMERARQKGYRRFAYDTFPNRHPGMAVLGLTEGFRVTRADYNTFYRDYRLRLEKDL